MIDSNSLKDPAVAEAFLRQNLAETNEEIGEVETALLNGADVLMTSRLSYRLDTLQKDRAQLSESVELADLIARIEIALTSSGTLLKK